MLTLPIREVQRATPRARTVRLDLNGRAFDYRAGQAILVANHGVENRRAYSIAISPEVARRHGWLELLIGVNATGHPGPYLTLEPGRLVDVEGPVGSFTFPDAPLERRFVFIAGGTGIAPLRAMLQQALTVPDAVIGVVYSARSPDEFAFETELRGLAVEGRIHLMQTVTRETGESWSGPTGRIDRETLAPLLADQATLCFICGPPALVDEVPTYLRDLGVAEDRIRIEEWG